jgi:hypothetical protein
MIGGSPPQLATTGSKLMTLMLDGKLLRAPIKIEEVLAPGPLSEMAK